MKIALIGPGIIAIPPPGWGAVEILVWDYYRELKKLGHEVEIINKMRQHPYDQSNPFTPYCQELIKEINEGQYDFVHLHYDCLYHILLYLNAKKIGITSHYPYIDQPEKHRMDGFTPIFNFMVQNKNQIIFALSKKDHTTFINECSNKDNLCIILNGANPNEINSVVNGIYKDRSIYIAKIEERKQQYKYCTIPNIDFYGKCDDTHFKILNCYKGEPNRTKLMNLLSNYGNLVLLSNGENGTPLVIKEALMAGLPIVTNKYSSNDLDTNLPFIDIIPDDKLNDLYYIEKVIQENRKKICFKNDIRKYAEEHFSWEKLVEKYISFVKF